MIPTWVPPGRAVAIGDHELFVRESADAGPAALLLHGWMATADVNFFGLYRELAGRRRVIAPDHRGHGRSFVADHVSIDAMADDAAALCEALGTGPVVVVGYSMGTAIAQTLAARRPDLVAGMVLSGGAVRWNRPHLRPLIWRAGWDGSVQRLSTGRFFAEKLSARASRTSPVAAEVSRWIEAEIERGHPGNLRDAGRSLARFDGRPLLPITSTVPTTVVVTSGDHLVPARRQHELVELLGADHVTVAGDHDSPAALAEAWSAAVAAAIDSVAATDLPLAG